MIITRIIGGLGNQLFQYAAGAALADSLGTSLKLDLSAYGHPGERNFDLQKLEIPFEAAKEEEISPFQDFSMLKRAFVRLRPPHLRGLYKEPHFQHDPHFLHAPDGTYLKGYWQSWKYVEPIASLLRKYYRVRTPYIEKVGALEKRMRGNISISVHIRRGDFTNPAAIDYNGVLPASYYNQALAMIREKFPKAEIFFFSDDINWVRSNLQTDLPHTFVSGVLSNTSLEDFHLMQQCKHQVIANSSFSWWAAWLNPNQEKTIIAPRQWFAAKRLDTRDLIPTNWIRI
jgi:hypothetical protein